jgi:hypothetical protein
VRHHAIDKSLGCDHGHYLHDGVQWEKVAAYTRRSFDGSHPNSL